MKRKRNNPNKGKKPNRKKSFTKSQGFAQSKVNRLTIKKKILNYFTKYGGELSNRELESKIGERETSISGPTDELFVLGYLGFKNGHHEFSKVPVKKYFLMTEEKKTQLNLFSDEG